MPESLMYNENHYVVLETNQPEQILDAAELVAKLSAALSALPDTDLPRELAALPSLEARVQRLLDTTCELDLGPDQFLQWYAIRLEK